MRTERSMISQEADDPRNPDNFEVSDEGRQRRKLDCSPFPRPPCPSSSCPFVRSSRAATTWHDCCHVESSIGQTQPTRHDHRLICSRGTNVKHSSVTFTSSATLHSLKSSYDNSCIMSPTTPLKPHVTGGSYPCRLNSVPIG